MAKQIEMLKDVDFIQAVIVDLYGRAVGKMYPANRWKSLLDEKVEILGMIGGFSLATNIPSFIEEFANEGFGNHLLKVDSSTLTKCPWSDNVAMVFCETVSPDKNSPNPPLNPRRHAIKSLELLKQKFDMEILIGVENEFWLIDKSNWPLTTENSQRNSKKRTLFDCFTQNQNKYLKFMTELKTYLDCFEIELDSWHMEYGYNQIEVPLQPYFGIKTCDSTWLLRYSSKFVADKFDMISTFMTSIYEHDVSSGQHLNHSLWKNGKNVLFVDGKLSELGEKWLAGIIHHIKGLTAFFYPTVNCYRRIKNAAWSPANASWNYDDRNTALRVKPFNGGYIENRLCTSASNIYLCVAAMVYAGIDGIENDLKLPEPKCISTTLPTTLEESFEHLQADKLLVKSFGQKFIDYYIKIKMEDEIFNISGGSMSEELKYFVSL